MRRLNLICDSQTAPTIISFLEAYTCSHGFELCRISSDNGDTSIFERKELLVFAPGQWDACPNTAMLQGIVLHVLEGGQMLVLGGGMRTLHTHEIHLMTSARFLREMPMGEFAVEISDHLSKKQVKSTSIWDTPWIYDRSVFDNSEILVSMVLGSQRYPLMWHRPWFRGHVYCAATNLPATANPCYSPILQNMLDEMAREGS